MSMQDIPIILGLLNKRFPTAKVIYQKVQNVDYFKVECGSSDEAKKLEELMLSLKVPIRKARSFVDVVWFDLTKKEVKKFKDLALPTIASKLNKRFIDYGEDVKTGIKKIGGCLYFYISFKYGHSMPYLSYMLDALNVKNYTCVDYVMYFKLKEL